MRVQFTREFNWRNPHIPGRTVRFKPGTYTVKRECGRAAVAEGAGVEIKTVRRRDEATDGG